MLRVFGSTSYVSQRNARRLALEAYGPGNYAKEYSRSQISRMLLVMAGRFNLPEHIVEDETRLVSIAQQEDYFDGVYGGG